MIAVRAVAHKGRVQGHYWFSCHFYDGTTPNGTSMLSIPPMHWDAARWPQVDEIPPVRRRLKKTANLVASFSVSDDMVPDSLTGSCHDFSEADVFAEA